jgi:ketopantoate reductase
MEENAKMFVKLASMKSDIMERLNIKIHQKKTEELKDKLEKKSPKKTKMLRSFFKKRNLEYGDILLPSGAKMYSNQDYTV